MVKHYVKEQSSTSHSFVYKELQRKQNHATVTRFMNSPKNVLFLMWTCCELLFVTNSISYMLEAGRSLKLFYPNMLRVTCITQSLCKIAEKMRLLFPSINVSMKQIFLKVAHIVSELTEKLSNMLICDVTGNFSITQGIQKELQYKSQYKICSSEASFARKSNLNFCQISYWRDRALTECVPSHASTLFVFTTWHGLNYYTKIPDHRSKHGPAGL